MSDIIEEAKASLLFENPFFGRLCMRLKFLEDASIPSACTDGVLLRYNKQFFEGLTTSERKFVLAHETMHCALLHPYRLQGYEIKKANIAMDYAINQLLLDCGFDALSSALIDPKYIGMPWEEIYTKLPEFGNSPTPGIGDVCEGVDNDQESFETGWQLAAEIEAQRSQEYGSVPEVFRRAVADSRKSKLTWQDELYHLMQKIRGVEDYTYSKPSYRGYSANFIIPSMYSESCEPLAVALDTSGSIDQDTLSLFLAELHSITETVTPATVHMCTCDAQLGAVSEWFPGDSVDLEMVGGGGTDFAPVFRWAESLDPAPKIIVYFTDLYGTFPKVAPSVEVLWVVVGSKEVAPFGKCIYIN